MREDRVLVIVLDSLGVGAQPDAASYGDQGSNTLLHVAEAVGGINLPHLESMGLRELVNYPTSTTGIDFIGSWGRMKSASPGKDTTSGHWELTGLILDRPFPVYPDGFPEQVISSFKEATGYGVLGNKAASGTEIIEELGPEHLQTGRLILYTSADSVFQLAGHEDVISPGELYSVCEKARELLQGEHAVGRVIARPFVGQPGSFQRTEGRRDYSLPPPGTTLLDTLSAAGIRVKAIGKIDNIFAGQGITESFSTVANLKAMEEIGSELESGGEGLVFANLVEFDMLYGHRNDPEGYAEALVEFDSFLGRLFNFLEEDQGPHLFLTADHGCDPTHPGTDHTREYVPLLAAGPGLKKGINLGTGDTFAQLAATVAGLMAVDYQGPGSSLVPRLRKDESR